MKHRVKVLSDRLVGAAAGDVVELDDDTVNVRALLKAGIVAPAPAPKRTAKKKADS